MTSQNNHQKAWIREFYQNLQTLAETAFPKKCNKCGKIYPDSRAFLTETEPVKDIKLQDRSGLFSMDGVGPVAAVGVFRNCACGTTMLADFHDRRDLSDKGNDRRKKFDTLLKNLCDQGISQDEARTELRNLLRGEGSDKLREWLGETPLRGLAKP